MNSSQMDELLESFDFSVESTTNESESEVMKIENRKEEEEELEDDVDDVMKVLTDFTREAEQQAIEDHKSQNEGISESIVDDHKEEQCEEKLCKLKSKQIELDDRFERLRRQINAVRLHHLTLHSVIQIGACLDACANTVDDTHNHQPIPLVTSHKRKTCRYKLVKERSKPRKIEKKPLEVSSLKNSFIETNTLVNESNVDHSISNAVEENTEILLQPQIDAAEQCIDLLETGSQDDIDEGAENQPKEEAFQSKIDETAEQTVIEASQLMNSVISETVEEEKVAEIVKEKEEEPEVIEVVKDEAYENLNKLRNTYRHIISQYDSDATEDSSGGESCGDEFEDEMTHNVHPSQAKVVHSDKSDNNTITGSSQTSHFFVKKYADSDFHLQNEGVGDQTLNRVERSAIFRYLGSRSSIAAKWNWLTAQISDLEYKIRQQTEFYRQIRVMKGPLTLEAAPSPIESCARVRPFVRTGIRNSVTGQYSLARQPIVCSSLKSSNVEKGNLLLPMNSLVSGCALMKCECDSMPSSSKSMMDDKLVITNVWCSNCMNIDSSSLEIKRKEHFEFIRQNSCFGPGSGISGRLPLDIVSLLDNSYHNCLSNWKSSHHNTVQNTPSVEVVIDALMSGDETWNSKFWLQQSLHSIRRHDEMEFDKQQRILLSLNQSSLISTKKVLNANSSIRNSTSLRKRKRNEQKIRNRISNEDSNKSKAFRSRPHVLSSSILAESRNTSVDGHKVHSTTSKVGSRISSGVSVVKNDSNAQLMHDISDSCSESSQTATILGSDNKGLGSFKSGGQKQQITPKQRNVDYDIDDIVIPYSVAASTRVERLKYKEIPTPSWRIVNNNWCTEEASGGTEEEEDLCYESYELRHHRAEVEERKRWGSASGSLNKSNRVSVSRKLTSGVCTSSLSVNNANVNNDVVVSLSPPSSFISYWETRRFPLSDTEYNMILKEDRSDGYSPRKTPLHRVMSVRSVSERGQSNHDNSTSEGDDNEMVTILDE